MRSLLFLVSGLANVAGIIVSDTGCPCATVKTAITAPLTNTSFGVGCSYKPDWNGQQTKWCLIDQTVPCGTSQSGFGYVDYCVQSTINPNITSLSVYTGQPINVTWSYTNIVEPELVRIGYPGKTLGTTNISKGFYSVFLPDAGTTLTTNSILSVNTTNPSVTSAISGFSITQSKIQQAWLYNQGALVVSGGGGGGGGGTTTIPCDGRNLTFIWQGIGNAQLGNASVYVKSNGGFGGTTYVGTAVQIPSVNPTGNTTVNYICPRTFVSTGGFTTYIGVITVQNPSNPTPYTINSASFGLSTAPSTTPTASLSGSNTPTTTPTPSQTPTVSVTPTPSLSFGATASITPSSTSTPTNTPSRTPSQTPTISVTPSITPSNSDTPSFTPTSSYTPSETPTPRSILQIATAPPPLDTGVVAGSIVGSILGLAAVFGVVRIIQKRQLNQIRRARLKAASRRAVNDRYSVYGVAPEVGQTIMYQVQQPPRRPSRRS